MRFSWDAVHWNYVTMFGTWLIFGFVLFSVGLFMQGWKKGWKPVLKAFVVLCLLFAFMILPEAKGDWQFSNRGNFNRVQYVDTPFQTVTGGSGVSHQTIIFFEDGRTQILSDAYQVPFPKSTPIRILTKNNLYKIEKDEDRR